MEEAHCVNHLILFIIVKYDLWPTYSFLNSRIDHFKDLLNDSLNKYNTYWQSMWLSWPQNNMRNLIGWEAQEQSE